MLQYIEDTKHAVDTLYAGIVFEDEQLGQLQRKLAGINGEISGKLSNLEFLRVNPDFDDEGIGTAIYWELYDNEPKVIRLEQEIEALKLSIEDRKFSLSVLAGGLFQIVKQGASRSHVEWAAVPNGRMLGSLPLKTIVLQARNQAMHWEGGNFHSPVNNCFQTLIVEHGARFATYSTESMAAEVVRLLGWNKRAVFEADLKSLL
jgi:hypothetical protein